LAGICLVVGVSSVSASSVVKTITVGKNPDAVSSDGTHVWVANEGDDTVSEIDAATGAVVNTITVGDDPDAVSSDSTHVWVANSSSDNPNGTASEMGTVSEIDAATGAVVNTITVGRNPVAVSSDRTHVWVANSDNISISPSENNGVGDTVSEIDAATGTVVNTIKVGGWPVSVSSDGTHVWVANQGTYLPGSTGSVTEIDAATGTVVKTIKYARLNPDGVSSDGTHVWVVIQGDSGNTVVEIDAATGAVVNTIKVRNTSDEFGSVSSDGTHVWVANAPGTGAPGDNTVSEILIDSGVTATGSQKQAIKFTSKPPKTPTVGGHYTVKATGGKSGKPVKFSIDSSSTKRACTISGSKVSFTGAGRCVIDAKQAGNATYAAAPLVKQTLQVRVS
jgi:YVTN family beta-propeller protein